jgi:hypothetical protein
MFAPFIVGVRDPPFPRFRLRHLPPERAGHDDGLQATVISNSPIRIDAAPFPDGRSDELVQRQTRGSHDGFDDSRDYPAKAIVHAQRPATRTRATAPSGRDPRRRRGRRLRTRSA